MFPLSSPVPARATAVGALLAVVAGTAGAQALPVFVHPTTGALTIGNSAPGNWNFKVEVGPSAGRVKVIDRLASRELVFGGITRIDAHTGAGDELAEFDIAASQNLTLNLNTGSGNALVKVQWKVPRGIASSTSRLAMASGAGRVTAEVDFEAETTGAAFAWTTNFGGGNKSLKGNVEFKEGVQTASKTLNFADLGGGTHRVDVIADSKAASAALRLNAGYANEVSYKVTSADPSALLAVSATTRGAKNNVEVSSAATDTRVSFAGGLANTAGAEASYAVVQNAAGTMTARLDLAGTAGGGKIGAKFDSPSATLALDGSVRGGVAADELKIETTMPTTSGLVVDAGAGDDKVELFVSRTLAGRALGTPTFRLGAGNDLIALFAASGSTARPAIDCGLGTDQAKASLGTATGCETHSR